MTRKRLNWAAWKISVQNCIAKLEHSAKEAESTFALLERDDLSPGYKRSQCSQWVGQLGTYIRRANYKAELAGDRYSRLQVKLREARDRAQDTVDLLAAAARLLSD